jgi:long-chain acyl-CoA synthetase
VGIHLFNSIDAAVVHMAVQYIGARSCFIDALVQPKSLDYYLRVTECRLLVTHVADTVLPIPIKERIDVLNGDEIASLTDSATLDDAPAPYDWSKDDVAYIYFTSGTTSNPKGVMLTLGNHENFTRICDAYWQPVDSRSKHLCFVPFSHGFGTIFLLPLAIRTGSELFIMRAFHPLRVINAIEQHEITHLYGVPSHYQQLLRLPDAGRRLTDIEISFCAGAKLEHTLMLAWENATGACLCEGYGLIETCCGIVWRVAEPSRGTGHMGPCPDPSMVEIAIFDTDLNQLPRGEIGQIAVRGPSVMKGYLGNADETSRVMHGDWFLTGDEGYVTRDGHLFMTGRIKDIINIAGIKVSPYEVEAVLNCHPAVAEAAVVAAPDALYGEVVRAYVRKKTNAETNEQELIRFASERLINFQVPKRIDFVEVFPQNNMGKLDRKKLGTL